MSHELLCKCGHGMEFHQSRGSQCDYGSASDGARMGRTECKCIGFDGVPAQPIAFGDEPNLQNMLVAETKRLFGDGLPVVVTEQLPKSDAVKNMLDLSTAHMPGQDAKFGELRVVKHEFGWIVFVGQDESLLDEPRWIIPIMDFAREHECILVNFDQDADVVDGLPTWEW